MFYLVLCFSLALRLCSSVPPSPTDSLIDDISNIKVSLKYLAGALDKWNTMYNGQVEPRMVSASNMLASLDSNIRNLQERAHVWDTFQLHISAWNDQLSSSDRKLDIISKAQEKLFNLDTKLNYIANLEYKLENVMKKLEETENSINAISKKLDDKKQGESLFGEFATRGILSTLKMIEKKLDKVHLTGQNLMSKQNKNDENKSRIAKCNNPPVLEEILHDVSSKVDVIFDKISEKDETIENDNNDYFEDQQIGSGDTSDEIKSDSDIHLLRKLLKRANHPCKQTNKALNVIITKVEEIENNTATIIRKNGKHCKMNALDMERMLLRLNGNLKMNVHFNFNEQWAYFKDALKSNLEVNYLCKGIYTHRPSKPSIEEESDVNITPSIPVTSPEDTYSTTDAVTYSSEQIISKPHEVEYADNITSCESLPIDAKSGVYNFTDVEEFNLRYCHEHWTIIQRRDNYEDLQNFSLSWTSYKYGFGDVSRDFWIGNEFLHQVSSKKNLLLRVELEDFEGNRAWAQYDFFKVASERENYKLFLGGYSGNASDSLSSHSNSSFSTYDRKNDAAPSCCPCSVSYGGGWWFNSCFEANLNGVYHRNPNTNEYYRGIIWEHWLGNYSLRKTVLMIKPRIQHINGEKVEDDFTFSTYFPFIEDP